ncbi:MAG: tetratricopeptide repeat protein [Xanthomonadales bacterium]|nr:tetratricopeptide repeat protein [Xanthomonadales bacterium]
MKLSHWFAALACATLLAASGSALAARKPDNPYPNATRQEPKAEMSATDQRDLNKAADLVNDGKDEEAQKYVTRALERSRSSNYAQSFANQLQGQIYYDQDKSDEAIAAYRKALEIGGLPNAQHFQVLYVVAQLQLQDEKYDEALASIAEWEKLTGTQNADELALKANAYYRTDKYQQAVDTMKQAMSMADKPNDSWNQILMASYFELGQYDQAAQLVQQQLAKDPTNIKLVNQLATVYIQADQNEKAAEVMAKAKNEGLITSGADYLQLAKLYSSADRNKDAMATMKEGFDKGLIEGNYDNYKLLGDICMQADDEACAIDAYAKASPNAPDGNVDYQLGYNLYYADRSREAVEALNRAIQKGKLRQEGEAYLLRGDAENDLDQSAAALADWQKAAGYPSTRAMAEQRINTTRGGAKIKRPARKN